MGRVFIKSGFEVILPYLYPCFIVNKLSRKNGYVFFFTPPNILLFAKIKILYAKKYIIQFSPLFVLLLLTTLLIAVTDRARYYDIPVETLISKNKTDEMIYKKAKQCFSVKGYKKVIIKYTVLSNLYPKSVYTMSSKAFLMGCYITQDKIKYAIISGEAFLHAYSSRHELRALQHSANIKQLVEKTLPFLHARAMREKTAYVITVFGRVSVPLKFSPYVEKTFIFIGAILLPITICKILFVF